MKLITIHENGLHAVFGRRDKKIFLLHFSDKEFELSLLQKDMPWEHYHLFEAQVSGKDQATHRGGKNIFSSEGMDAEFVDFKDYKNTFGRKIEVVQCSKDCEIISHYQFFGGIKTVRAWTEVKNISPRQIVLEHVSSFYLCGLCKESGEKNYDDLVVWQSYNSWYCEGQWRRRPLFEYGVYRVNGMHSMARVLVSNTGSWSSKEYLPMGCVEDIKNGQFMLWQIESGGSWNYELGACFNELYLNLFGPSGAENHWYKKLVQGEAFVSDAVAISFGKKCIGESFNEMITYRRRIRRNYENYKVLPIVYNPYMHDAWDYPYADHMEKVALGAKELGADVFCIDAGWHDEDDIMKYIGAWRESKTRYPLGLKNTFDKIREQGLQAGMWLEIETAGLRSPLRKLLDKDCFFLRNGESPINNGRMQLDFNNPKVVAYANEVIDRLMRDYQPGYIKMDYNHDSGPGTEVNSDSFGDGLLNHVRAYRKWLVELMDRYPNLVIEDCGSGGLRLDYYHLADHSICSTSDEIDYKKYPYIAANIVTAGTPEQMGVWCYPLFDCDEEEVIFNVVNCALHRMQLSGGAYKQEGKNRALLKEGIAYHRKVNQEKTTMLPFWPLGFADFNAEFAAYGLKNKKKAYLCVWNMGTVGERTIPLSDMKVKNVKVGYPANNSLACSFDGTAIRIVFDKAYQARVIEMDLED